MWHINYVIQLLAILALLNSCVYSLSNPEVVSQMNKVTYKIANSLQDEAHSFRGEFFEMFGPETTTRYSEVFWAPQKVKLPDNIIKRFDGKVMAVTGYEVDIVRTNANGKTTSVLCWEQYNHHYSGWMSGKDATTSEQHGSDDNPIPIDELGPHGQRLPKWEINHKKIDNIPSVQVFSEGNGNEHRASYHGYAKGYAQLIASPIEWRNNPMIINTNKRLTGDTSPGPINHKLVPRSVLSPPDSLYSGILECPCTTRKIKVLDGYRITTKGVCISKSSLETQQECTAAAKNIGLLPIMEMHVVNVNTSTPTACTAKPIKGGWSITFNNASKSTAECGTSVPSHARAIGSANSSVGILVQLILDASSSTANITLSGASNGWFGVAFNATAMQDNPYAIIIDGEGKVQERQLGKHTSGLLLNTTVTMISNVVNKGRRTVVLTRKLVGETTKHFTFDAHSTGLSMLTAQGTGSTLNYHGKQRDALFITLAQAGTSICVCRDPSANSGSIGGIRFNPNVCAPYPKSELLPTHNSICNISEYNGGLYCCHGGSILLDADQPVPKKTDTWRLKYRFYFENYTNQSNVFRSWWSTEATNNEYNVPKSKYNCLDPATPEERCTHTLVSKFSGREMISGGSQCMVSGDKYACANVTLIEHRDGGKYNLIYAAAHCHAPACMSLELWNDDTGELICRNEPTYGTGSTVYNETAYIIAIPPCVWGSTEEGLRPPPIISLDSNLTTVKRCNNTNGHWGVMALWQMRSAYIKK